MKTKFCLLWLLLSPLCFFTIAQYSLDGSTIDGGGGTDTGGPMIGNSYSVTGTIGQPENGRIDL